MTDGICYGDICDVALKRGGVLGGVLFPFFLERNKNSVRACVCKSMCGCDHTHNLR